MDFSTRHSFFAKPLFPWKATSVRPQPNKPRRKRKNRLSDDEEDEDDEDGAGRGEDYNDDDERGAHAHELQDDGRPVDEPSPSTSSPTQPAINETSPSHLPTRPHNPRKTTHSQRLTQNLQTLADNNLFLPRKPPNLRSRHQGLLVTILHTSLLTRDWDRAKRAFALLLRGEWVDLRRVWAVGAEILWGHYQHHHSRDGGESARETEGGRSDPADPSRTLEYMNRLIIQYPYLQNRPGHRLPKASEERFALFHDEAEEEAPPPRAHAHPQPLPKYHTHPEQSRSRFASAIHFYPDMVALLIRESGTTPPTPPPPPFHPSTPSSPPSHPHHIHAHLEELMLAPPFSDDHRLWLLRGMVCLWLIDLEESSSSAPNAPTTSGYETPTSLCSEDEDEEDVERRRRVRREREGEGRKGVLRGEAEMCFGRVVGMGGGVPGVVRVGGGGGGGGEGGGENGGGEGWEDE
ncbi:hypothetical protein DFH27DRAFT_650399 [Peziza echinospora]|nr:hypothetical protein DFH27DRAFT_650399 [Peziza echinospora]